jgi:para-nitrobenzyl esterase
MIDAPEMFGDGAVLPLESDAVKLFADPTRYNAVPVILGTNRDEPALFMVRDPRWVENRLWIFPRLKDEASYLRHVRYGADSWRIGGRRQHRDGALEIATRAGFCLSVRLGRRELGDGI